jgi:antitoxin (DNA-binding transcriptional repressor) of toxin-antitoxin stability system
MTTLTITDAKKNLGKWLQAAARGEEVGIISGAEIIALRKVPIQSADYAWTEYGVTQEEVASYEQKALAEHARLKKAGKIEYLTAADLRKKREEASRR